MNKNKSFGAFNVNTTTGAPMEPSKNYGQESVPNPASVSVPQLVMNIAKSFMERLSNPFKIIFPANYYNPVGADSFDIRALDVYDAGEDRVLMTYVAKEAQTIRFIKYGFFTNIVLADNVRVYPTIDGNRILRYHGDPDNDFAINLSVGPDLTENSLIPCDFELKTGEKLEIRCVNTSGTKADIGARFRGYLVNANENSRSFGG